MGEGRAPRHAEMFEESFAYQMRRLAERWTDADVYVRLAEVYGQELRVAVGEVHERHLAPGSGQGVKVGRAACGTGAAERQAGREAGRKHFEKFATPHESPDVVIATR